MRIILQVIFMSRGWALAGKLGFTVMLLSALIAAVHGGEVYWMTLFVTMPIGFVLMIDANVKMERYYRIMPIRPSMIVLARFIQYFISLGIGVVLSVFVVVFFSNSHTTHFNFILLYFGAFLMSVGAEQVIGYAVSSKHSYLVLLSYLVPIANVYIIFGPSTIHNLVRNALAGYHVMESELFANPTPFVIFVAVGFAIYIAGYFASVALYKKTDHKQHANWLMYV